MNVLSLFDGISCGRVALERAGIKVDKYYASEIKEDAIKVSQDNWKDIIQVGDITKLKGKDFKDIDLIIGGSPCQSFSIAGNREGFVGKSGLFYEFVKLLKEIKPKYFLLENVKMKKEWQDIISKELGVEPININSKVVSAQLRNRFYWTNIPNVIQPEDKGILLQSILENGYTDRGKARAILESESRPLVSKEKMYRRYKQTGFTTIVYLDKNLNKENIRYFTQTELEKLQTLPVGYTKCLTRNKAAGVIGDGWTVDVIAHILRFII
jgi:site-specific DNA-cytosine methylase